jgi:hypothetical protein|tara:strand:- start:174 stop:542 length:369 start_codon:yes stop_codon:yes gene_type:complete
MAYISNQWLKSNPKLHRGTFPREVSLSDSNPYHYKNIDEKGYWEKKHRIAYSFKMTAGNGWDEYSEYMQIHIDQEDAEYLLKGLILRTARHIPLGNKMELIKLFHLDKEQIEKMLKKEYDSL